MAEKTLAIMQPTFLPWIGYFAMMDRVDEFIFLDSVQYAHRTWQQRNRVKTPRGPQWLTVPTVSKGLRHQLIRDVRIDVSSGFFESAEGTLRANYGRAPFFSDYAGLVIGPLQRRPELLSELTESLILSIAGGLGIKTPCVRSSEMESSGAKADLLVALCRERGATRYLSAPGSKEYIVESGAFEAAGIEVIYHEYPHPVYPQLWGDFVPYMSIADLLFNAGPASLEILRAGGGNPLAIPPSPRTQHEE